jgi:hypothetical protein
MRTSDAEAAVSVHTMHSSMCHGFNENQNDSSETWRVWKLSSYSYVGTLLIRRIQPNRGENCGIAYLNPPPLPWSHTMLTLLSVRPDLMGVVLGFLKIHTWKDLRRVCKGLKASIDRFEPTQSARVVRPSATSFLVHTRLGRHAFVFHPVHRPGESGRDRATERYIVEHAGRLYVATVTGHMSIDGIEDGVGIAVLWARNAFCFHTDLVYVSRIERADGNLITALAIAFAHECKHFVVDMDVALAP